MKTELFSMRGGAVELAGRELEKYKQIYFAKLPAAKKWESITGIKYYMVLPKWIRFTDMNKEPWEIFEIRF